VAEMPLSYPTNCHGLNEFRDAVFKKNHKSIQRVFPHLVSLLSPG